MLPAEVCRVAGHPVEVRCLSSEVCRARVRNKQTNKQTNSLTLHGPWL